MTLGRPRPLWAHLPDVLFRHRACGGPTHQPSASNPQRLDFESQPLHTVVLEALNKFVDPRFADLGTFRDQAIVRVAVTDVDEPPEFRPPSGLLEVQEDAQVGSLVGVVTARDPDAANRPVR